MHPTVSNTITGRTEQEAGSSSAALPGLFVLLEVTGTGTPFRKHLHSLFQMYSQTKNNLELSMQRDSGVTDTFCHCDVAAVLQVLNQDFDPPQIDAAPFFWGLAAMDEEENPHDGPGLIKLDMTLRPRVGIAGNLSAGI